MASHSPQWHRVSLLKRKVEEIDELTHFICLF